jgi:hypothetical protein
LAVAADGTGADSDGRRPRATSGVDLMAAAKYKKVEVNELNTFVGNPRRGDVDAIAESLTKHGQYRPIVVNVGTHTGRPMEVLAGNHTMLAARSLGWKHIDVALVDVDEATAKSIVAADNRLADKGGYDEAELLALLESLDDLDGTGYVTDDLQDLRDLADSGLWDKEREPAHRDDDDAKFNPRIAMQVPHTVFEAWTALLAKYEGKDDVEKLTAHLKEVGVL